MYSKIHLFVATTIIATGQSECLANVVSFKSLFVTESLYKEAVAIPVATLPSPVEHDSKDPLQEPPSAPVKAPSTENSLEEISCTSEPVEKEIESTGTSSGSPAFNEDLNCRAPCEGFCYNLFSFKELLSDYGPSSDVDLLYEHGFVFLSCVLEQLQWE
ncbi:hypothetical protein [Chlamydiifrater volucris]|uniref:hypothetical protein n=1 Tax=Chlamydiifrater volucris TaxID=2681470 RepID=UPI001BCEA42C|nr:hypothetical protein [Chlamydiifrater volucris]